MQRICSKLYNFAHCKVKQIKNDNNNETVYQKFSLVTDAAHAGSATDSMCGQRDLSVSLVGREYKDRENGNKDGRCHPTA
jgi:hypothetical protein